jgi:hypothetical protein
VNVQHQTVLRRVTITHPTRLARIAGVAAAFACIAVISAQTPPSAAPCDQGVIQLPARINGTITVCSALAQQVPALSRQLQEITKAVGTQQQLAEMNRLIRGVNGVSQNIGMDRQAKLLGNLFSQLQVSQRVGAEQTERQMAALADGFEQLKDQLIGVLTNKATADRATAAVDGPLGDAIAQLDLTGAEQVLADIRAQLRAIGTQVEEVNRRTTEIQRTLEQQRMEVPRVSSALASADVASLKSLTASGLAPTILEEALRRKADDGRSSTAGRFFENSLRSSGAMEWLDAALAAGADPNMTVPNDYYGQEGLLAAAMRAGNADAIKVLLRRGASPHPYEDVFLTSFPVMRFLFPLTYVAADDRYSLAEKQALTKAFLDAGVVIPKVVAPKDPSGWPTIMYEVNSLQEDVAPKLGMRLPASMSCCSVPGPIWRNAWKRTGEDWCAILASMPKRLHFEGGNNGSSPVYDLELEYLLNISQNRAHFLALTPYYGSSEYVLVEVSKDGSSWTVLRFMPPEAGMGLCKSDDNGRPDNCWRRVPLHRIAGTQQMRFDDWGLTWSIVAPNPVPRAPR